MSPQGAPGGSPPQGEAISIPIPLGPNGERPTPEQIQQIQQQLAAEAQKHGISIQEYVQRLRQQAMAAQMQAQQEAQQQQQQQQQPIQPGPPKPEALAVANWLRAQELKPRTVIHDEKRKDMFRGRPSPPRAQAVAPTNHALQSNEPSAPSSPPPTKRPAQRTRFSPKSTTAPRPRTPSSCCPCPC